MTRTALISHRGRISALRSVLGGVKGQDDGHRLIMHGLCVINDEMRRLSACKFLREGKCGGTLSALMSFLRSCGKLTELTVHPRWHETFQLMFV